ncbi:Hypothetical protein NTJ_02247 [Nesidiocoris tenuis]|uniref:Uncharacterized protein n=1 Tax=Nesidiocoris tenuis TaxID=355587 RepID=A0ABN7AAU2_9HEMI|nr:Hypothetical protein NTJ_02247 [Nesidiocoris tenuis]
MLKIGNSCKIGNRWVFKQHKSTFVNSTGKIYEKKLGQNTGEYMLKWRLERRKGGSKRCCCRAEEDSRLGLLDGSVEVDGAQSFRKKFHDGQTKAIRGSDIRPTISLPHDV